MHNTLGIKLETEEGRLFWQRKGYITVLTMHILEGDCVIAFSGLLLQQYKAIHRFFFPFGGGVVLLLESSKSFPSYYVK